MRIRRRDKAGRKIETQMASLIDVVFLLLIFFVLTLKVVQPEGDFQIKMPVAQKKPGTDIIDCFEIKVHLLANADGSLASILFNDRSLGTGEQAYERLNRELLQIVDQVGQPLAKDLEVEIDADYGLDYQHTLKAVSACTGRLQKTADGETKLIRYLEKIKFAPAKQPT